MEMRVRWVVPSRSALTSTERIVSSSLTAKLGCVLIRRTSRRSLPVPQPFNPPQRPSRKQFAAIRWAAT